MIHPDLEPLPARLRGLPLDSRGYPVPWFVAWINGKPEFRASDQLKLRRAVFEKRCWVCGETLGRNMAFVIGPMCGINRITAEPPCHLECAEWSARNCPFLNNAKVKRREDETFNADSLAAHSPGIAIARNPGVSLIWVVRFYECSVPPNGGILFNVGEPDNVIFYRMGRKATRAEVLESIAGGFHALLSAAETDGPESVAELNRRRAEFEATIPG